MGLVQALLEYTFRPAEDAEEEISILELEEPVDVDVGDGVGADVGAGVGAELEEPVDAELQSLFAVGKPPPA
jgi:hypothetical protein